MRWIFRIIIEALQCSRGQKVKRSPRSWKPVHCHHNVPGGVHGSAWDENLWVLCTSREAWMSWVWLCKWLCCKCTGSGGGLAIWCDLLWHCWHRWRANSLQIVLGFLETLLEFFLISGLWQFLTAKEKQWAWCSHTVSRFRRDKQTKAFFWRPHIFLWLDTKELQSVTQGAGSLSNWFRLFFPLLWKIGGREGEVQGPALPSQIASPRPSWWCPSPLPG